MAEKSEELVTLEDKISQAKELYGRGSRNYLVKSYTEAADDLSQVCKLYEDIYGQISDELGMPYLLYAKALIALAQDENKVIDVPEEEQDDEDDDNDEEDGEENGGEDGDKVSENDKKDEHTESKKTEDSNKNEKSTNGDAKEMQVDGDAKSKAKIPESNDKDKKEEILQSKENEPDADTSKEKETDTTSEHKDFEIKDKKAEVVQPMEEEPDAVSLKKNETESSEQKESDTKETKVETVVADKKADVNTNGNATEITTEPSTSNGVICEANDENNEEDDEAAANLQVAWEILELAAKIFERQGEKSLSKLAEVYGELAGISFENSHFEAAITDYKQSLDIHMKLPDDNRRIIAEIHYKIGLANLMQNSFDDCIRELKKASELIDDEIEAEKQKENLTEKQKELIKDLEETKQDIIAKIVEVEETKQQSIEEVRNELSKLISTQPQPSDGAGPSSSGGGEASSTSLTAAEKPKATDISHLIKRKKPDTIVTDVESSPAKRPAV